jgi:hypothetical protein
MARQRKYPVELLDRGARVVFDSGRPIEQVWPERGARRRRAAVPARPGASALLGVWRIKTVMPSAASACIWTRCQ